MKRLTIFLIMLAALLVVPAADTTAITIKVASLAPEGSPWHNALKKISTEWLKISDGRVKLKIYAGGVAGDETDMIRKMRINQIQAAALTGKGLGQIHPDFFVYQLPFLTRSDEELDYLFSRLRPELEELLEDKGFTFIAFARSGWLRFFSTSTATTPDDFRKLKLFSLEGSPELDRVWNEIGFYNVPLQANDVIAALQNGMVEAFAAAPIVAATMQWFALAPNMNDFYWSPLTAGLVISNRAWRAVPEKLRLELKTGAQAVLDDLDNEAMELEKKAIEIMKNNGLIVHPVEAEKYRQWKKIAEEGYLRLVGSTISREVFDQAASLLEAYRQ